MLRNNITTRVTINKTADIEHSTDTLKKLNNKIKLGNSVVAPLPPDQIKCNILKGKHSKICCCLIIAQTNPFRFCMKPVLKKNM